MEEYKKKEVKHYKMRGANGGFLFKPIPVSTEVGDEEMLLLVCSYIRDSDGVASFGLNEIDTGTDILWVDCNLGCRNLAKTMLESAPRYVKPGDGGATDEPTDPTVAAGCR
ncbi:hypothetical protein C5167_006119 [Papaver somniferum]|uniref:Uncharacterized protein n=1 Tax=Papaver somniferum TaxID=3469 RepID=A0A4Y7JGN7_PAPSO|nr:hypothetical protein C5167_006119 [Papaver somniferum]